jgi:hypothetical protein
MFGRDNQNAYCKGFGDDKDGLIVSQLRCKQWMGTRISMANSTSKGEWSQV